MPSLRSPLVRWCGWTVALSAARLASAQPQAAVGDALRAVEAGDAARHAMALRARLAASPGDRIAALGLATTARLTYDYALADSLYDVLGASGIVDDATPYVLLGRGQSLGARGLARATDSLYSMALAAARHAPAVAAEAMIGRVGVRGRLFGPSAAVAMLDSARALVAAAVPSLAAHDRARLLAGLLCGGAIQRGSAGQPGVVAAIDSGMAAVRAAGGPLRSVGLCHFARAQEHARSGVMWRANAALDSAGDVLRRAGDRATLAAVLQWRGYVSITVGDYESARHQLGLALVEGTASEALQPTAWALANVGETSRVMGDVAEATDYFRRAEAIFARLGDERGAMTARGSLAAVALSAGDTAAARAAYRSNLAWADRADDWQFGASAIRGLAEVAAYAGEWDAADAAIESWAALVLKRGGDRWAPSIAWARGMIALRRGDAPRAERELRRALPGYVVAQGNHRFRLLAGIAEARLRQGDVAGADSLLREASDALDTWRASLSDARLRSLAYQVATDIDVGSVERVIAGIAAAGRVASAFEHAERRRARTLRDALLRVGAATPSPGASAPSPPSSGRATSIAEVAATLDRRDALALLVAGPQNAPSTLFVVTARRSAAYPVPPDDSLRILALRLRARVEDGRDATAPARALGEALFGPAGARLPVGLRRLVVVPDGALHVAPLALVDPDGRGPLGVRVALSTTPSATVAALLRARPRDAGRRPRVLAFGDPAFQTDREVALARLPRSADEARDAARLATGSRVLLGADASEAALRATSLREFSVVHLAAHAYVHATQPWATLVALAPGGGEDGFLRASELAALPLDADLVVLSACGTAGGSVLGGEGVQGFTAPLLGAGARAVVATEWALRDGEAARGMAAFYDGLRAGLAADEALRRARRVLRDAGAPVREWGAYSIVGDAGVHPLPRSRGWLRRLVGR